MLNLLSPREQNVGSVCDVRMRYHFGNLPGPSARVWLFWDIRQEAGWLQCDDPSEENFLSVHGSGERQFPVTVHSLRTLDLYPEIPEFLGAAELRIEAGGEAKDSAIEVSIDNWVAPGRPINEFSFWLVDDVRGKWEFQPTGYKSYRQFVDSSTGTRIEHKELVSRLASSSLKIVGNYPAISLAGQRQTPGVFWGELHGMAFNQRPLDDFYKYAKNFTHLDFCAAMRFSYNTCVGNVWQDTKDAARRHTEPGRFVAFAGFECGTPEDDSHRCAYFPDPDEVPPIFCESRPPARDPMLHSRFHPDTILCRTTADFYAAVRRYGGFVGGHFHTTTYDQEILAEIWQKQDMNMHSGDEEERLYDLLRRGKRFGLIGGSDTHDSMPGNPNPEPGCPNPAGLAGVYADALTTEALTGAFLARRVFATTGARIAMEFDSNGHPMGSELPEDGNRRFHLKIDGTAELSSVELLRDGNPWLRWAPGESSFAAEVEDEETCESAFYLIRTTQVDGHKGWTSPIWFGSSRNRDE